MKAAVVVGLLFLAGAVWNFVADDGKLMEGCVALAISALLFAFYFYVRSETRKEEEFLCWLIGNSHAVSTVGANYLGIRITSTTILKRYEAALSCLIYSFKATSRSYIKGHHAAALASIIFSGFSLAFGWWGVPWGPVFTVQALNNNFSHAGSCTVGELLARLSVPSGLVQPTAVPAPATSKSGA